MTFSEMCYLLRESWKSIQSVQIDRRTIDPLFKHAIDLLAILAIREGDGLQNTIDFKTFDRNAIDDTLDRIQENLSSWCRGKGFTRGHPYEAPTVDCQIARVALWMIRDARSEFHRSAPRPLSRDYVAI